MKSHSTVSGIKLKLWNQILREPEAFTCGSKPWYCPLGISRPSHDVCVAISNFKEIRINEKRKRNMPEAYNILRELITVQSRYRIHCNILCKTEKGESNRE